MKTKALLLTLLMSAVFVFGTTDTFADKKKKEKKTIVLKAEIHCKSCKAKIEKNIPFEKGVKDLKVDMKKHTITITYRTDKNTKENLIKAVEKLGIKVFKDKKEHKEGECTGHCDDCDHHDCGKSKAEPVESEKEHKHENCEHEECEHEGCNHKH